MAAMTGSERGLPVGSYLNDTVEAGPDVAQVSVVWQPYEDKVREKKPRDSYFACSRRNTTLRRRRSAESSVPLPSDVCLFVLLVVCRPCAGLSSFVLTFRECCSAIPL